MGVDTKGFLFGENKENFSIEKLVQYLDTNYTDVGLGSLFNEKDCLIYFKDSNEWRMLFLFQNYSSYCHENYPNLEDGSIILFDLGCWGNSVKIMEGILEEFGGGYIIENDCNDDWKLITSDRNNRDIQISNITKIMVGLSIDNKKASEYYKIYNDIKDIMEE